MKKTHHNPLCLISFLVTQTFNVHENIDRSKLDLSSCEKYSDSLKLQLSSEILMGRVVFFFLQDECIENTQISEVDEKVPLVEIKKGDILINLNWDSCGNYLFV